MRIIELSRFTSAPITFLLVDQSSPVFFVKRGSDGDQSSLFPIVDLLVRSGDMATKFLSCPKLRAQSILGGSTAASVTFLMVGQSSPIFRSNTEGMAVNQVCFQLLMS